MTQYRKISKNMASKLKPKEAYLFYCLALKANLKTYESNIKQLTLANEYGIKKEDFVKTTTMKIKRYEELKKNKSHLVQ